MNSPFIKFCGITNQKTASFALNAGADAIGFIAYPKSPRFVSVESLREILKNLRTESKNKNLVGVFVNADFETIQEYGRLGLNTIQLHGEETEELANLCRETGFEVWKAVRAEKQQNIEKYKKYPADKFLIDAFHPNLHGGTGKTVDLNLAAQAIKVLPAPVILAGGLNYDNVMSIFNKIKPWGLDINSGVEITPGQKNHEAIRRIIELWH